MPLYGQRQTRPNHYLQDLVGSPSINNLEALELTDCEIMSLEKILAQTGHFDKAQDIRTKRLTKIITDESPDKALLAPIEEIFRISDKEELQLVFHYNNPEQEIRHALASLANDPAEEIVKSLIKDNSLLGDEQIITNASRSRDEQITLRDLRAWSWITENIDVKFVAIRKLSLFTNHPQLLCKYPLMDLYCFDQYLVRHPRHHDQLIYNFLEQIPENKDGLLAWRVAFSESFCLWQKKRRQRFYAMGAVAVMLVAAALII
jgi:hypothetical protein